MRHVYAAFTALALMATPVFAQSEGPSYDKGTVWDYAQVKTVDGHFDD
jgi:hypothetical protein